MRIFLALSKRLLIPEARMTEGKKAWEGKRSWKLEGKESVGGGGLRKPNSAYPSINIYFVCGARDNFDTLGLLLSQVTRWKLLVYVNKREREEGPGEYTS